MDNPYQAPQSNVDNGIIESKNKTGWKIFFWVMVLLHIALLFSTWADAEAELEVYDFVVDFILYPFIFLGLFGYAYNKQFLSPNVWKATMVVGILSDVYSIWRLIDEEQELFIFDGEVVLYVTFSLVILLSFSLMFVQYLGLYRYGYNSPEIWDEKH